jgi:hypothetical protein
MNLFGFQTMNGVRSTGPLLVDPALFQSLFVMCASLLLLNVLTQPRVLNVLVLLLLFAFW